MRRAIPAAQVFGRRGVTGPGSDITGAEIEAQLASVPQRVADAIAEDPTILAAAESAVQDAADGLDLVAVGEFVSHATNLLADPQLKTIGSSANAALYPVTHVSDVTPPGTSWALRATRQGTPSAVLSSVFVTPTYGNALIVPVTPGAIMSFGAKTRTDQTGMKAQLGLQWLASNGLQVGSSVAGAYDPIAVDTWELRTILNRTVPDGVMYASLSINTATVSGGNAPDGGKTWAGAIQRNIGATLDDYIDGEQPGCRWLGTPHASGSYRWRMDTADVEDVVRQELADPKAFELVETSDFPARGANSVLDPQLLTAGASFDGAKYAVSRVTDVTPPDTDHAMLTTRAGTLDSILSSVYVTSPTYADPLGLAVTPGEVRSHGLYVRTDQAGMKATVTLQHFDATNTPVGSAIEVGFVNLAADTWTALPASNRDVPATATHLRLGVNVLSVSGSAVTSGGKVWVGRVQSNVGATLAPYVDGAMPGSRWVGTPHESESYRWRPEDSDIEDVVDARIGTSVEDAIDDALAAEVPPLVAAEVAPLVADLLPRYDDRVGIPAGVYATGTNMDLPNQAKFTRLTVTRRTPIYGVAIQVLASAGNIDVGVYDNDGPGGLPGTRLASSGSIAAPATGNRVVLFTTTAVLDPGIYWLSLASSANPVGGFAFSATASQGNAFDNLIVGKSCTASAALPLPATIPQPIYQASSRAIAGILPMVGFLGDAPIGGPGGLYPTRPGNLGSSYVGPYYEQASDSTYCISDKNWIQGTIAELDFTMVQSYAASDQLPSWTAAELKHAGLLFAAMNNATSGGGLDNNYVAMISVDAQQFQLVKQVSGVETILFKRDLPAATLAFDTRYKLAGFCDGVNVGSTLMQADGTVIDTHTVADSTWRGGYAGGHGYAAKYRVYGLRSHE